MIFVTVGTHEQQHDRLIAKIDELAAKRIISEDIFIQRGYSRYVPKNCRSEVLLSYQLMEKYFSNARLIITHGGPCSIIQAMVYGKIPIVVPRMKIYDEHVDNHQVQFTKFLEAKSKIIAVYEISKLSEAIQNYEIFIENLLGENEISKKIKKNVENFSFKLEILCRSLISPE